jgi:hypothetical protein
MSVNTNAVPITFSYPYGFTLQRKCGVSQKSTFDNRQQCTVQYEQFREILFCTVVPSKIMKKDKYLPHS